VEMQALVPRVAGKPVHLNALAERRASSTTGPTEYYENVLDRFLVGIAIDTSNRRGAYGLTTCCSMSPVSPKRRPFR